MASFPLRALFIFDSFPHATNYLEGFSLICLKMDLFFGFVISADSFSKTFFGAAILYCYI